MNDKELRIKESVSQRLFRTRDTFYMLLPKVVERFEILYSEQRRPTVDKSVLHLPRQVWIRSSAKRRGKG